MKGHEYPQSEVLLQYEVSETCGNHQVEYTDLHGLKVPMTLTSVGRGEG